MLMFYKIITKCHLNTHFLAKTYIRTLGITMVILSRGTPSLQRHFKSHNYGKIAQWTYTDIILTHLYKENILSTHHILIDDSPTSQNILILAGRTVP